MEPAARQPVDETEVVNAETPRLLSVPEVGIERGHRSIGSRSEAGSAGGGKHARRADAALEQFAGVVDAAGVDRDEPLHRTT